MDEEKGGITFGDICRTIWSQKWLALILLLVITIAGTLALKYGYGAAKSEYASTFSVNITLGEDGLMKYPSGTSRNYRDLISIENLKSIKAANEDFASVNIEGLRKSGNISISQNRNDSGVTYTVRVKASYFSSEDLASQFIHEIASTPSHQIQKWVDGLAADAEYSFNDKCGNEQKLNYLKSQLNDISERFSSLGGISNAAKEKVNGCLVRANSLEDELLNNYYEPDKEALKNYENRKKGLERELAVEQNVVDSLEKNSGIADKLAVLDTHYNKIEILKQQINDYSKYLENNPEGAEESQASKDFTANLNKLLDDIKNLTSTVESNYYKNTSLISYDGAPVREEGSFGFLKSALVSFVAGFIVSVVVAYIVGWIKLNKKSAPVADDAASDGIAEASAESAEAQDGEKK